MTPLERKRLFVFGVLAVVATSMLDLWLIKRYDFWGYIALNIMEWTMFASGYVAGDYFTTKKLRGEAKKNVP